MGTRVSALLLAGAILVIFTPVTALAESYDPTPLTASQIFEKARTAYGTLAPGTYKEVERVAGGGVERTITTFSNGSDYVETVEGGGFTSKSGRFQKQSWGQDENGVVTRRSNFRAREDPNALALRYPDDPKYRVRVLGITQTQPRQYVVQINPPGGVNTYRYYDASTFMLARVVTFARDGYRHVAEYSDYRNVSGRMEAFATHAYDGRTANDRAVTVVSYEKTAEAVSFAIPPSRKLYTATGTSPITLPARITPQGIVIRAQVNGRGLDFVVDSGASGLFIDPGVAHQLGLTPFGKSRETIGGGDVDEGLVRIPSMNIGSLGMNDVVFTTTPYAEKIGDSKAVGLMGFDFISSGILEVNFQSGAVNVYPRAAFNPQALGLRGVPAQLDDGVPRVAASMEGVPGNFLVDTGGFGMMVYHNYVDRLPSAPVVASEFRIGTVGGQVNAEVREVTDFIFGGVRFMRFIGRTALVSYRVFFDYEDNMLYVSS